MKQTSKITLCAICSALSIVVMLMGIVPYFTYAVPAIAGLFVIVPLIEIGIKYAFASYLVSGLIIMFFPEQETKILFILLFGYYPIIKALIEKLNRQALEWLIKIGVFTASVTASYFLMRLLIKVDVDDFGPLGKYGVVIFLVLCYVAFILYDIAISRVSMVYTIRIRPNIRFVKK